MAGGFIFEKTIDSAFSTQGSTDKSLIIDPNYAYQVPFDFTDWNDIKIGMFVSYVMTGAGVDAQGNAVNGNSGIAPGVKSAGGVSNDSFNYIGIMKSSLTNSLPLASANAGYLGLQADKLNLSDRSNLTQQAYYNKLINSSISSDTAGDAKFIATQGSTILESLKFLETNGNFNVVGLTAAEVDAGDGSPENTTLFCDYWGMRFTVIDKGDPSTQRIRFTASINGTEAALNRNSDGGAISDPSMQALKLLMNGVGEFQYKVSSKNMHNATNFDNGFVWNDGGSTAYSLPDSLFFYNAFQDIRPRIHAWAVKKIS